MNDVTDAGGEADGPRRGGLLFRRARLLRTARELGMELIVVALGVLIALWAQQWAEGRSWREKTRAATEAVREEISLQYSNAVEWRVVSPCVMAQVDRLRRRVLASGARLDPAPSFTEGRWGTFVLRMPSRPFFSGAWQRAVNDGVASRLDPKLREMLDSTYSAGNQLEGLRDLNDIAVNRLLSLSRPLPLDAGVRVSLLQELDELQGRAGYADLVDSQLLRDWATIGMLPAPTVARKGLLTSGSYSFCRAHGLPMRPLDQAARPD